MWAIQSAHNLYISLRGSLPSPFLNFHICSVSKAWTTRQFYHLVDGSCSLRCAVCHLHTPAVPYASYFSISLTHCLEPVTLYTYKEQLVAVATRIIWAVATFSDINVDLVFLITTHVWITHKEDSVAVSASRWCQEVQLDFCLLLQGQTLNWQEWVIFGVTDDNPPAFLSFLSVKKR